MGIHAKYPLFLSDFNESWIYSKDLKYIYIQIKNINQNPSRGTGVVPCGRADGQTNITKLRVAFRKFAKAPKKSMCVAGVVLNLIYVRSGGTAANATAKDYDNSLF